MTEIGSPAVYNDLSSLTRLKAQSADNPEEVLEEAAKQFESLFVSMMLKAMRDTLPEDSMFGSSSMDTYQEMFDKQLALDLSRKNGIGLAEVIAKQISGAPRVREPDANENAIKMGAGNNVAVAELKQQAAVSAYTAVSSGAPAESGLQSK